MRTRRRVLVGALIVSLAVIGTSAVSLAASARMRSTSTGADVATSWVGASWISSHSGWVLGEGTLNCSNCAVIEHTENGGATWSSVPAPRGALFPASTGSCATLANCARHILFVSAEDGYLFGPDLLFTTDGGTTWHRYFGHDTASMAVVAPGVIWKIGYTSAGCPGPCGLTLQQERAGSTTWVSVPVPFDGFGTGIAPQIVSAGGGRVLIAFYGNIASGVSSHATFYETSDLGRTWTTRSDPCGYSTTRGVRTEIDAVDTSATSDGVVVVECQSKTNEANASIVVSRDGGATFGPRRSIPHANAFVVSVASATTVLAATGGVGGGGPMTYTVELTTDGGSSWRTVFRRVGDVQPLSQPLGDRSGFLSFESSTVAYWIGSPNYLWVTTDAGREWTSSEL